MSVKDTRLHWPILFIRMGISLVPCCIGMIDLWWKFRQLHIVTTATTTLGKVETAGMCRCRRGETGGPDPPPLKITKTQGFLAILTQDPLKITKLPSQHSMVGHYRHNSETPFQWRFAGGPMMAHFSGN